MTIAHPAVRACALTLTLAALLTSACQAERTPTPIGTSNPPGPEGCLPSAECTTPGTACDGATADDGCIACICIGDLWSCESAECPAPDVGLDADEDVVEDTDDGDTDASPDTPDDTCTPNASCDTPEDMCDRGDGCNFCACEGGAWACTASACDADTGDADGE